MNTEQTHRSLIPKRWIGVFADWQRYGLQPWEALVELPRAKLKTHALLIGATGSGKTTLLHHLIAQDIETGHSLIVLDLRGDLVTACIEMCAGRVAPEAVKILDLRERERPLGFDPLSGEGESYFRALHVLDVVAQQSDSFGVQLAETLRNALMVLAEAGQPLTELERLLTDAVWRSACQRLSKSESTAGFWRRFDNLSPEKQAAFVMPVLNKISLLLATANLRKILGHPAPLDLGAHLNTTGNILLVSLAGEELHGAGRMLGSIILSAICREIFARVGTAENQRNPVRLVVDEFENFGGLDFASVLAEGRRFGLSLILAHQSLAQLSPLLRSLILNNVGVKFVFRCGREDAATLSRDLTGDPKAFDFPSYPVGRAAMWLADNGVTEIEINAPILRDIGNLSRAGREFLEEVYAYSHPVGVRRRRPLSRLATASGSGELSRPRVGPHVHQNAESSAALPPRSPATKVDLEDWLCS
jgi:hypothetical protein